MKGPCRPAYNTPAPQPKPDKPTITLEHSDSPKTNPHRKPPPRKKGVRQLRLETRRTGQFIPRYLRGVYPSFGEKLAGFLANPALDPMQGADNCMLRTKVLAASGLLLTLSSLLLGTRYWGYPRAVVMLQAGGLSLVLGMFYRVTGGQRETKQSPGVGMKKMRKGRAPTGQSLPIVPRSPCHRWRGLRVRLWRLLNC